MPRLTNHEIERSIDDLEYWHKVHDRVLENTGDPARAVRVADRRTYDTGDPGYITHC